MGPRDKQGVQLMSMGVGNSKSMQMVTQIGCWDVNKGQQVYDREKTFSQDMANPFLRRIKQNLTIVENCICPHQCVMP